MVTVRRTEDPFAAAEAGNSRVTKLEELPATISPRADVGKMLDAGTPFKDADVILTPVAVPNPVAVPYGVAVTRIG
jgi:hypothetical protein